MRLNLYAVGSVSSLDGVIIITIFSVVSSFDAIAYSQQ